MSELISVQTLKYTIDLSDVKSGIKQAKSDMSSLSSETKKATAVFREMEGSANVGRAVTGVDVAKAKLALVESDVEKARAKLKELESAANAGKSVTGLEEARAKLTLFEAKAQGAREDLHKLQTQGDSASTSLARDFKEAASSVTQFKEKTEQASSGFHSSITGMIGNLLNFGSKLGMTIFGLKSLIDTAINAGKALLEPAESTEQMGTAFTNLLGSTKAAKDEIEQLDDFAAKTPFQTMGIDKAGAQLIGFGIKAKDVIPDITAIGDALFAVGHGSQAELDSVVEIFGKIQTAGKLTGDDLQQLGDHGINATKILAAAMHKTVPEIQDLASRGLLPADDALKALTTGIENNPIYKGGMAKQANSLSGIFSTLTSNLSRGANAFLGVKDGMVQAGSLFDYLEKGFGKLGDFVASKQFQDFADSAGKAVGQFFDQVGKIGSNIDPKALSDFGGALHELGKTIDDSLKPAFDELRGWLKGLGLDFDNPKKTGETLTKVVKGLTDGIHWLSDGIKTATPFVGGIATEIKQFAKDIAERLKPELDGFQKYWTTYWPQISEFFSGWWDIIEALVKTGWASIKGLFKIQLDLLNGDWGKAWDDMDEMLGGWWDGLKTLVKGEFKILIAIISGLTGQTTDELTKPWHDAYNQIVGVWNDIQALLGRSNAGGMASGDFGPGKGGGASGDFGQRSSAGIKRYATGTSYHPGGFALVGEDGPELVTGPTIGYLPRGSRVTPLQGVMQGGRSTPAYAMAAAPAVSGGGEQHIHVYIGDEEIAHFVANRQMRIARLRSGRRL